MRTSEITDAILLLARSGAVTNAMVARACGLTSTNAGARLAKLVASGRLVKLEGKPMRWELAPPGHKRPAKLTKEQREAAQRAKKAAAKAREVKALADPPGRPVSLRKPIGSAPVAFRDQVAVVPPGVQPTRGPSYLGDPRYQVLPGERVFGAGFSAVGIGRDVETGRGWGEGA